MKNLSYEYSATAEISTIICDLHSAELIITPSHGSELGIFSQNGKRLDVSLSGDVLKITQGNCSRFFVRKRKRIELRVPDCTVPQLTIEAKHALICVSGGIYDKLNVSGEDCTVECANASFADCTFTGTTLSMYLKGVTVKNALVAKCDEGDAIWVSSFASRTECRIKRGNIGLSDFTCKDSIMTAENGNVAARLKGEESDYSLGLMIKDGTANRESNLREGAARSFKAYSAKGNIAVDFVTEDETSVYGNN